jgi:hypothetical protein
VLSYLSAERLAGPGAEASTWVNTAWNGGVAAGLALAGADGQPHWHGDADAGGGGGAGQRGPRGAAQPEHFDAPSADGQR